MPRKGLRVIRENKHLPVNSLSCPFTHIIIPHKCHILHSLIFLFRYSTIPDLTCFLPYLSPLFKTAFKIFKTILENSLLELLIASFCKLSKVLLSKYSKGGGVPCHISLPAVNLFSPVL